MKILDKRCPLPTLTGLRFFAAAEVVMYHEVYATGQLANTNIFLRDLASGGYEAVTFFFMLSGFILTYVYTSSTSGKINVSAREFWKARFARIYPAYLLGLTLALPHFYYSSIVSKITPFPDFILGLILVPLLQQTWWPLSAMAWNTPAWSLSVEVFFYLCFPFLTEKSRGISSKYFITLSYIMIFIVSILRHLIDFCGATFNTQLGNFNLFFPFFHLPQFLFGMALGRLYLSHSKIATSIHTVMLYVGVITLGLVLSLRTLVPWWVHSNATLVLIFALIIFGGARTENNVMRLFGPTMILLGEASYSIYILHMPLGWLWNWVSRGLSWPVLLNIVAYFAIILSASIASYLYVEKPVRRWILGHDAHRPA